ncbi:hypothetical protein BN130_3104 [Cronobacter malonaticus 507]|nr:hypothetical protein BN130_3104 [Cronobacter malonaticus 507]
MREGGKSVPGVRAPGYPGDASHPQLRQAGKPSFLLAQIRL